MFLAFPARCACDTRSPTASGSVRKTRPSSWEMPNFSRRVDASEIMDDLGRPDSEFDQAYRELEIINRRLGGIRAIQRFLPSESNLLMLDVAAGACDVSEALLGRMGARIVVLDVNLKGLEFARTSWPVRADALELPFSDDTFDVVMASLFFPICLTATVFVRLKTCGGSRGGLYWLTICIVTLSLIGQFAPWLRVLAGARWSSTTGRCPSCARSSRTNSCESQSAPGCRRASIGAFRTVSYW